MTFLHRKTLGHALAALGLAFASLAAQADTASITRNGGFVFDHEVHSFDLDIASASDLRLWTTSYAAGQVDPVLALFDRGSGALLSLSDDVDGPYPLVDASQGLLDAGMRITDLAAGHYRVAVSMSPNLPAGSSWAEGYLVGGPGNAVTSSWTVRAELINAAPVPEPESAALLLSGLLGLGLLIQRHKPR